ncbi:DEAD/DEAH box helicase [Xaviernesmea oryzae]|uniref:DEAD/DEAH box helicase n=1 Tax=Xaviernesmea oryzae TaxID=464029 RepID=UPI001113D0F2|nr:DEAD/DEAH box helicase [Xaviernesmea oryzae]
MADAPARLAGDRDSHPTSVLTDDPVVEPAEAPAGESETAGFAQTDAPAGLIALHLLRALKADTQRLVYVARSEAEALGVAEALCALKPEAEPILLPPWDCLPYDRVEPSRQAMGRRMDALRVWLEDGGRNRRLLVTSLDALLQRVAPKQVILAARYSLAVGDAFERDSFTDFVERMGYLADGVVDEPGEVALRDEVVEIFPAGGRLPMRIMLAEDGTIEALRFYDPLSQRTVETREEMVFGPASELVFETREEAEAARAAPACDMERRLLRRYETLVPVLDILPPARLLFAESLLAEDGEGRVESQIALIEDARNAARDLGAAPPAQGSLYLSQADWKETLRAHETEALAPASAHPAQWPTASDLGAWADLVAQRRKAGARLLWTGAHPRFSAWLKRLARRLDTPIDTVADLEAAEAAPKGALMTAALPLADGFSDAETSLEIVTAQDLFGAALQTSETGDAALQPQELGLGDLVVHQDHGLGRLQTLETIEVDGLRTDAARLDYHGGASLLVPMRDFGRLWRYGAASEAVTLDRLHTEAWAKKRAEVSREIDLSARRIAKLTKIRAGIEAPRLVPDKRAFHRFVLRFPYPETRDQTAAIAALLADLGSGRPMNRLICGDVGFGKTEIALRAAAAAAFSGHQAIVVAPTTVLARQHALTFERRFAGTGKRVALLSRLVKPAEIKRIKAGLADGSVDIVVATSAILAKDVHFARAGLLVIDEEHRFGARDKAAMRKLGLGLHVLVMSATPIPRTLQEALVGLQEVSLLTTPPARRRPVRTFLCPFDRATMATALRREKRRGGQSFLVVPEIEEIDAVKEILAGIVPDLSVVVAHGRMPPAAVDEAVVGFAEGRGDVLLSTNLIESGLDVPGANTIFIWRADRFGLAQLHQLRGRVGRGRAQGIAYLLASDDMAEETRERLSVLTAHDRLGDGLAISRRDLDLRGTGDLFGEEQAGHVKVIGTGLYQDMLAAALAGGKAKAADLFATPEIRLGLEGLLPEDYVPDAAVRLNLYARLLKAARIEEIDTLEAEIEDRFGEPPDEARLLLRLSRLSVAARRVGLSTIEGGPLALALTPSRKPPATLVKRLKAAGPLKQKDARLILPLETRDGLDRLARLEDLLGLSG